MAEGNQLSPASGNCPRRNSLGKASASSSVESILPHYLRASTGSCHDFCKFGREHAVDTKARRLMPKRVKEVPVLSEKKKIVPPAKPPFISKSLDSGDNFFQSRSRMQRETVNDGNTGPSISSRTSKSNTTEAKKLQMSSSFENRTTMVKARPSISSSTSKAKTPKAKKLEISSSSGKEVSMNRDLLKGRKMKLPAKFDTLSTTKSVKAKPLMPTDFKEDIRSQRSRDVVKIASKKVFPSPKSVGRTANLSTGKQKSLKFASPRTDWSRIRKDESDKLHCDEVHEKTLYVIKMEKPQILNQNEEDDELDSPLHPFMSSSKSSSPPSSSSLSHNEGENTANEAEDDSFTEIDDMKADMDKKGSSQKMESSPPSKLNFSRGKIVEIQSQSNSPRRLKFRRGRLFGENQKITDSKRRSLKKVEEVECETVSREQSTEKVVLRHQDMQGKKDCQGLFNNVIEETASKLVGSRKSKVKALVGAFETVISLQEIKPSARTAT